MRRSRTVTVRGILATGVLVAVALPALPAQAASPGAADAGVVANAAPYKYTPNIANGAVKAIVQVGNRVIVGGTFTTVVPVTSAGAGASTTRRYLMAFNATTGALDTGFVPAVNGEVDTIVATAGGTGVYIAGRFTSVSGTPTRVALLRLSDGGRVTTWNGTVNGPVNDLALVGSHLLVGGYFTYAGAGKTSVPRGGLTSLSTTTGAVESYLAVQLTGHHAYGRFPGSPNGPVGAIQIAVSPDRTQAIVDGNFRKVADSVNKAGYDRDQIVKIKLAGAATVDANWSSASYTSACYNGSYDGYMRDISWSPDGRYYVVTTTGGYHGGSFENCDSASRFEASATGQDVRPTWTNYTGTDSLYAVAVTSSAVYVGGHQRWLNNPYGQDYPGPGAVARPGLAALNPANGVPLSWNPGRLRGHGAEVIYATASGVWVGSDTDYIGNYAYKHQKLAFFPFAGGKAAVTDNTGNPGTVFQAGTWTGSGTGAPAALRASSFNAAAGTGAPASPQPSTTTSIDWSTVRGAFMLNGRIWYGSADGTFHYRNFNGKNTFGPATLVDPYNDPYWSRVQTGSGQTYKGTAPGFYSEIPSITGMFYANKSIYYTLQGDSHLYKRAFSADTLPTSVLNQVTGGVISPVRETVAGSGAGSVVDFSDAGGLFLANGSLWVASRTTGQLSRTTWSGSALTTSLVLAAGAGGDWSAPAVFVAPA